MSEFIKNYKKFSRRLDNLFWKKYPNWYVQFKKFEDERFTKIKGYLGFYFISNYGQVVSFHRRLPFIKKYIFVNKHFGIELNRFGESSFYYIHNLVYKHFLKSIKPGYMVFHKNGVITDNYFRNLKLRKKSLKFHKIGDRNYNFSLFNQIEEESSSVSHMMVPVLKFNLNGQFIKEYPSIKRASVDSLVEAKLIASCCRKKSKIGGRYQWRFKNDPIFCNGIKNLNQIQFPDRSRYKPVQKFDLNGKFIKEYISVREASRDIGKRHRLILHCINGHTKAAYGFQWRYKSKSHFKKNKIEDIKSVNLTAWNARPVLQFDLKGKFIREYASVSEAARISKVSRSSIVECGKGKNATGAGYQWRYRDSTRDKTETPQIEPVWKPKHYLAKPVYKFSRKGRFISEFSSISEAAKKLKISASNIRSNAVGKRKSAGGFRWKFKSDADIKNGVSGASTVKKTPFHPKTVLCFDLKGEFVSKYKSIKEAAEKLGIDPSSIGKCLRGKLKTVNRLQWRYKDDLFFEKGIKNIEPVDKIKFYFKRPVLQFDSNGSFIREYASVKDAAVSLGLTYDAISSCLLGKVKTSGSFQWRYLDDPLFQKGVRSIAPVEPNCIPSNAKIIIQFDKEGNFIQEYKTIRSAARSAGINHNTIAKCAMGGLKTAAGFIWKFK